jgi:tetratricopeptide (TPR) repeat protein
MRIVLALITATAVFGADADDSVARGFDHFYNLEYDQAIAEFERAIALRPDTPELHNYLAQSLLFREMLRNGALESELVSGNNSFLRRPKLNPSPETEQRLLTEIQTAINLAGGRLERNPDDPAALYAQGISHGLRSNYYWLVKKAWRNSLRDATQARKLHNRVSELQPDNVDARLVQGLHDYVVGSLPLVYRMLGFMVGFRGDKQKGIRTVQEVALHGKRNRADAQILLCALYRRENRPGEAVSIVGDLIRRFPRNYLLRLELAQMHSMAGDGKAALVVLEEVTQLKLAHAPGYDRVPWEKIWFQAGVTQFWYNDLERALENLKKVTAHPQDLDLNTGVQAYLRMGQIYDLTRQRPLALEAYRKAIAFAPEADAAQQSRRYLSSPYRRAGS